MRTLVLFGLLLSQLSFAQEQEEPFKFSLQDLWHKYAKSVYPAGVRLGAKISDPVVYETESDKDFVPASVTKMFTLATVLAKLGPDFKFETKLTWEQSGNEAKNVQLVGDGDPTLKEEVFKEFAEQLKLSGVDLIRGPIVVSASDPRFDDEVIPPGNWAENLVWCFGAQPASFNIDQNCALAAITGLNQGSWFDLGVGHSIRVDLEESKTNDIQVTRDGDGYVISGFANPSTFPVYLDLRVLRPIDRASNLMQMAVAKVGIAFSPEAAETKEAPVTHSYVHSSIELQDFMKPIIKASLNPPMEALQRYLGKKFGGSGTLAEEGARVIHEYLAAEFQSSAHPLTFVDGSGLSRSNFVNAAFIYDFLVQMKSKTTFDPFVHALSVGGVDGTLKRRWVGTKAEGHVFAKTGTLTGHSNVAGYLTQDHIPFVLLNDFNGAQVPVWKVRNAQNKMVLHWFDTVRPQMASVNSSEKAPPVDRTVFLIY